ncbi:MAG: hypothetical protein RMI91_11415 [Gemmatales bacterium]|nr:hypothetical protein [Gemmatales bacterium]MDW7995252.1 hypothetical protein [Gemmatales bacterium]
MKRLSIVVLVVLSHTLAARGQANYRLHDGVTLFVHNTGGQDFTFHLSVRDLNLFEHGPREVLVKVYDPWGNTLVRQVLPDDGITKPLFQIPMAAWDHEAWFHAYAQEKGAALLRWSAQSDPERLATVPKRDFTFPIRGGAKGIYRIMIVGCTDHYVTWRLEPELPYALSGHPDWLHGQGGAGMKAYVYVPRGSVGLHVALAEYDQPRQRRVVVRAPDGRELVNRSAEQIFWRQQVDFDQPGKWDDQVLTVEVSPGKNDYLLLLKLRLAKNPQINYRGELVAPAVWARDEATARAVKGGAIYHDGQVFWHGFQVRFHAWLNKLRPEDFEVRNERGELASPAPGVDLTPGKKLPLLPQRPGFLPVNGPYWHSPLCDVILHHWPAHKNRAALHLALRDLHAGLRSIGPNDHVSVALGGPFANLAYEFSNYAWHYWRPAWRILRHTDAPEEVKAIVREAFLVAGDRLAFCRSWERINGNAFAQVVAALRYCSEATGDPLQKELFDTYCDRFANGGWGERVGVGPSGPVQEGFAYEHHYGSYMLTTWQAVLTDLPDERLQRIYDGVRRWFSYTLADENIPAGAWSSRTHYYPHWKIETEGPFAWKGLPGPDFTESINHANEWFAARRKNYYILTYHGRLSPKWMSHSHLGQSGYGGGMICQLHVPGRGLVLASVLNGAYGENMDVSQWRTFRLHTLAGTQADGAPFVAADSEHFDARLVGQRVESSGAIRGTPLYARRAFTFAEKEIICEVQLQETPDTDLLTLWLKHPLRGRVREAYELIPFLPQTRPPSGTKPAPTTVAVLDDQGKIAATLDEKPALASAVIVDRGGFGVRIHFDKPRPVFRTLQGVLFIQLTDQPVLAREIQFSYRLLPFGN